MSNPYQILEMSDSKMEVFLSTKKISFDSQEALKMPHFDYPIITRKRYISLFSSSPFLHSGSAITNDFTNKSSTCGVFEKRNKKESAVPAMQNQDKDTELTKFQ